MSANLQARQAEAVCQWVLQLLQQYSRHHLGERSVQLSQRLQQEAVADSYRWAVPYVGGFLKQPWEPQLVCTVAAQPPQSVCHGLLSAMLPTCRQMQLCAYGGCGPCVLQYLHMLLCVAP